MPTSLSERDQSYRRTYKRTTTAMFIVYSVVVAAGLAVLIKDPNVAVWISDSAQAEFVGAATETASAPDPFRPAQLQKQIKTVRAD